jgi:hypothetical protein
MVRSLIRIVRMAGTARRFDPGSPGPQPDTVVTQWTYESITVLTAGWEETGGQTRPAGQLPALPAPKALGRGGRALRTLLRPQSRGGRLARAALFAAGMAALPIVARPVGQLLRGRRELPRLPEPKVPLLPPATDP